MLTLTDWNPVLLAENATDKVNALNNIITSLIDNCFPLKTITIKSSDQPWYNNGIRKAVKKRKRHFKRYGRDKRWHELKKKTEQLIENAKQKFYEEGKASAKAKNDPSTYYKLVGKLKDGEAPEQFDIKNHATGTWRQVHC